MGATGPAPASGPFPRRLTVTTSVSTIPEVLLVDAPTAEASIVVLGAFDAGDGVELALAAGALDDATAAAVLAAARSMAVETRVGAVTRIPQIAELPEDGALIVGLGDDADIAADTVRRAAGAASRALTGVRRAASTLGTLDVATATEGAILGGHVYRGLKTDAPKADKAPVGAIEIVIPDASPSKRAAFDRAVALAESVVIARDLVNTPPSHLYPETFAARARELGERAGLEVEVLDEERLAAEGYGGILAVGRGSSRPPRLVRLVHRADADAPTVALVGKGVTFDTGGISIKPAAGMDAMTSDMGGAAAVIAATVLAARLGVGVNVIATVPMAENMPSSTAYRPGDVITQYGGTTVEVLNTDAEGRLILADAIVRACEDSPGYLIDTATLTGAQLVALGKHTPGVMGTPGFRDRVAATSRAVGENGWAMPLPEELREGLESRVADLTNVGPDRWGGMLLAAVFLREFVADDIEWAHIDIAGPAYNDGKARDHIGRGGTGVPVRTLIAVIEEIAAEAAGDAS